MPDALGLLEDWQQRVARELPDHWEATLLPTVDPVYALGKYYPLPHVSLHHKDRDYLIAMARWVDEFSMPNAPILKRYRLLR